MIDRWGKLFASTQCVTYDLDNGTVLKDYNSENGKWKIIEPGSLQEEIVKALANKSRTRHGQIGH